MPYATTGRKHHVAFILMALVFVVAALFAGITSETKPAQAATCTHPTYAFYPGNKVLRWRYGEVDFHFDICTSQKPFFWGKSVSHTSTNGTGSSLGVFIESASIYSIRYGSYWTSYKGQINWKECAAKIGWPCYKSGHLDAYFTASVINGHPSVRITRTTESFGIVLYRTP